MGKMLKPYEWRAARKMWEEEGLSYQEIADRWGISKYTVQYHKRQEGWGPKAGHDANGIPLDDAEPTPVLQIGENEAPPVGPQEDLEAELAAARARISELEQENENIRPTFDVSLYVTNRIAWIESVHGPDVWEEWAHREFAKREDDRYKQGLPRREPTPEMLAREIEGLKQKELNAVQTPGEAIAESARKTVKMVLVRNGVPTIEQIPMEPQINNMAGSLADGLVRYTDKGFKVCRPFLCLRAGCNVPAAVSGNDWTFDMYCSQSHRNEVEGEDSPASGIITSGMAAAYTG